MFSFFQNGWRDDGKHPSGDELLLYVDGELSTRAAERVRLHLETCWGCRVKTEKVEETISTFMEYRSRALMPAFRPPEDSAGNFRARLHSLALETQSQRDDGAGFWQRVGAFFRLLLQPKLGIPSSAVAMVLIAAIWFTYVWTPPLSASTLLEKSAAAEASKEKDASLVLHSALLLEKRRAGDSKVLSRWHIDTWHSGERGITVRRLYDDAGNFVAGVWDTNAGATVYQRAAKHWVESAKHFDATTFDNADDVWQFDFSAIGFKRLVANPDEARVQKQAESYVLTYEPMHSSGNLLKASLTVNKADLHAHAMDFTVSAGSSASATSVEAVTYSMIEDQYEEKQVKQVKAQVFDADPEMIVAAPAYATPDLQIKATYLLDRMGVTLGKQVTATIGSDRKLHIEGLVTDKIRKAEVMAALGSIASNPAVKVNIMTFAEAQRHMASMPSGPVSTAPQADMTAGVHAAIPVYQELSQYFQGQAAIESSTQIPQDVRHFSEEVTGDSRMAMRHAWALKSLVDAISPDAVSDLSATARADYFCMIAGHAEEIGKQTEKVRKRLDPVFYADAASTGFDPAGQENNLAQAIGRLFEDVSQSDTAIQSSFTLTTGGAGQRTVKDPKVRESLMETERLVGWVSTVAGVSNCDGSGVRQARK